MIHDRTGIAKASSICFTKAMTGKDAIYRTGFFNEDVPDEDDCVLVFSIKLFLN